MMQMKKKIIAVFSILLLLFVLIVGIQIQKRYSQNEIKTFTAFFSVILPDNNLFLIVKQKFVF